MGTEIGGNVTETYRQHVAHPSAWRGSGFESIDDVSFTLTAAHVDALDAALQHVKASGLTLDTVERADFDLTAIADDIAEIEREILHGRGIVILRGFPIDGYSVEDIEIMYWGLGCYLGVGESQSTLGDRIGRVEDVSGKDRNQRAYRNSVELLMHTDLTDIIGMLSVRKAPVGGLSSYVSVATLHNEILTNKPEYLEPLYRGFRYHRFGSEKPGQDPVTEHEVPVLSEKDGVISARYVPDYIYMAYDEIGEPIPEPDMAALDYLNALTCDPELRFDVMLEPGDLSLINNYAIMHTRSAFDDGPTLEEKRLLLRLWLSNEYERPMADVLDIFAERGISAQEDKDTYYSGHANASAYQD